MSRNRNFKSMIKAANVELEKVSEWLKQNNELFKYQNLKLYGIAWNTDLQEKYNLTDKQYSELFYMFCADSYRIFLEDMKEENIKDTRNYLGKTSSFNLDKKYMANYTYNHGIDFKMFIYNMCYDYCSIWQNIDEIINDKQKIDLATLTEYIKHIDKDWLENDIKELKIALNYIATELMYDIEKEFADSKWINDYITEFKENQVGMFMFYIENNKHLVE